MSLYHTKAVMFDKSEEVVILEADSMAEAMRAVRAGLESDGRKVHYTPIKRKVSKAQALKLIEDGARCWATF
ncbi:hypothetical protein QGX11_gp113 [Pseudomonas phage PPSC2]|uniref:Uncharacterized protein n=1 Tax=Pseudomonas phage PPSC2 TaxID=2041350 RepID=A0A2R2YAT3_9CAUD|nr:hypothetical protein QGX11_gp113 [Pseudomonas phage PPSC2]ATN92876.1 hypothetical protein PPSC2_113 [Pseudomonas phage PPSC2]